MSNGYVSPTGYTDPNGSWGGETLAYNNNTDYGDAARCTVPAWGWSNYLILTINPIYCSKLRFFARYEGTVGISKIDIDVYSEGSWYNVFEGSFINRVWMEKALSEARYVSQLRVRFYNSYSDIKTALLYEAQLYKILGTPKVTTNAATGVAGALATLNGNITSIGGAACTTRGFKYKEGIAGGEVDVSDSGTFLTGTFSEALTGLDDTKKYYFRAYATNSEGTAYGGWLSFGTTVTAPTVTSNAATSVDHEKAILNGNITTTGGQDTTERGFQWKMGVGGDVDSILETGTFGIGIFSLDLEDLSANVQYYFRAYAKNAGGIGYGDWLNFTTDYTTPEVITHNATDELEEQAIGNGEIVSTGGKDCDERGFEYGLSKVATWEKKETAGNYGVGFFDITIDGLVANTEYWYRAWAKYTLECYALIVANPSTLQIFSADGNLLKKIAAGSWSYAACDITLDTNKNVYLEVNASVLKKYDSNLNLLVSHDRESLDNWFESLTVGPDGYLYTLEVRASGCAIAKRSLVDLTIIEDVVTLVSNYAGGICQDSSGNFYIYNTTDNKIEKWNSEGVEVASLFVGNISEYAGFGICGSNLYIGDTSSKLYYMPLDLSGYTEWSPGTAICYAITISGDYLILSGWNGGGGDGATSKYDSGRNLIWTKELDPGTQYAYKAGGNSSFAPAIGYGEWVKFITAAPGAPGDDPTGTIIPVTSDPSGYTNQIPSLRSSGGGGGGSCVVYVKRDSEPAWQKVGEVTIVGEEEILVLHLPCDIRAKHFLFKVQESDDCYFVITTDLTNKKGLSYYKRVLDLHLYFRNHPSFKFLGMLTEAVKEGSR